MREGQPSLTARAVSFSRGVGLADDVLDPLAERLLPDSAAALVRASRGAFRPLVRDASRLLSGGLVDHVTLRTLAIDRAVTEAVASGARQCVILGAGLDSRAHRLEALAGLPTFEVDHPVMQAEKKRRMAESGVAREGLVYAPIDFQRDSLADVLVAAGHDPMLPTVWVWEGVTMYLTVEATQATLGTVARASAGGSALALTYIVPDLVAFVPPDLAALGAAAGLATRAFFAALGEPLRGTFSSRDMAELLHSFGFEPLEDTSSLEWARLAGSSPLVPSLFRAERLVVARKRG